MWETAQRLVNDFVAALPRLGAALVVFAVAVLVARTVRSTARRFAARRSAHRNLGQALGRLAQGGILILGILVAAVVAFPNFKPADVVQILGIGGVAIGFAFKDIFQNFLAGILLLVTEPFRVGDEIVVDEFEGTVEEILTRATLLRTDDGRRVVIPNADLFTKSVIVNTARPTRRFEYDIGIGYGDDLEEARRLILDALVAAPGVLPDPEADVILVEYGESSINLRARWWSSSRITDALVARDKALTAIRATLGAHGIDMPYPTRQVLFHDQTEETDGDRARQREGWPARPGPD